MLIHYLSITCHTTHHTNPVTGLWAKRGWRDTLNHMDAVSRINHRYSIPIERHSMAINRLLIGSITLIASLFTVTPTQADTYVDVTVGFANICGLTESGNLECRNNPVQTRGEVPADLPPVIAISAGQQHTCVITDSGEARCWLGFESVSVHGNFNQTDIPAIDAPLVSLSAGENHTCAVDVNNRVWCWGLNSNDQITPPNGGEGFVKVSAATNYSCGIQTDGNISCWSSDARYTATDHLNGPFIDLDTGNGYACGLAAAGDIQCWGRTISPPSNGPYLDLTVSTGVVCGLTGNQTLDCTANANRQDRLDDIPVDTMFTSIGSGHEGYSIVNPVNNSVSLDNPACGLTIDNTIECWGSPLLPRPPGTAETSVFDVSTLEMSLTATNYLPGDAVELFWNSPPEVNPPVLFEVYRNDELQTTTDAMFSWYDSDSGPENEVRYKIRPVDSIGNTGPFSPEITVNKADRTVTGGGGTTVITATADIIRNVTRRILPVSMYLSWSTSADVPADFAGFQILVNGQAVANTQDTVYFVSNLPPSPTCLKVSIVALSTDGHILDFETVLTNSAPHSDCF